MLQVIEPAAGDGDVGVQVIAVTEGANALPGSLRTASWRTVTGVLPRHAGCVTSTVKRL